jgi:N-acetylmuramoyl-L-alanine amidase CwlA
MAVKIGEHLTAINLNVANRTKEDIHFIVIHYVGATGGALDNCRYFARERVGASAHLFVGHEGEVYRCVADKDIAWHCGGQSYYNDARNANSIGIELCCRKSGERWYFETETLRAAVELIREYMATYDVPLSRVVRHYDVTRKLCPEPFCGSTGNDEAWKVFKSRLETAPPAPSVVPSAPPVVPPVSPPPSSAAYTVRVTANTLNIRTGPGTQYAGSGSIADKGVYTIVEEANGPGAKRWGKLGSGAGWISLDYTTRT